MKVIDLDEENVEFNNFKLLKVIDSHRSIGDTFQTLISYHFKREPVAFVAHRKHLKVFEMFKHKVDYVFILDNPKRIRNCEILHLGMNEPNASIHLGYYCPWLPFRNFKTTPRDIDFKIPKSKEEDIVPFNDGDVLIIPSDGGNELLPSRFIKQIIKRSSSLCKSVWVNFEKIENTKRVTCDIPTLINSLNRKNVSIISQRCGLTDILYFTTNNPMISYFGDDMKSYWFGNCQFNHPKAKPQFGKYMRDNVKDVGFSEFEEEIDKFIS